MEITESDIARIQQILLDANETVRKKSIKLHANKLMFRLLGSNANGSTAMAALWNAGLNGVSDGDLSTRENWTDVAEGAASKIVTMTIGEGGLWTR